MEKEREEREARRIEKLENADTAAEIQKTPIVTGAAIGNHNEHLGPLINIARHPELRVASKNTAPGANDISNLNGNCINGGNRISAHFSPALLSAGVARSFNTPLNTPKPTPMGFEPLRPMENNI